MPTSHRFNWRLACFVWTWMFCAVPGAVTLLSFGARWAWIFDGFCHFRAQYFVALIPGLACFIGLRAKRSAAAMSVLMLLNVLPFTSLAPRPAHPALRAGRHYRFVLCNVLKSNRGFAKVRDFLQDEAPDLVVLEEVDDRWMSAVRDLMPHWKTEALSNNFGIALGTRLPLRSASLVALGRPDLPAIVAEVEMSGRRASIIATHPVTPMGNRRWRFRNDQLRMLAEIGAAQKNPVVLIGDLNVTSSSPFFADLLRQTGLRDTRTGFGFQTSWPTAEWFLRIPIDHCLVSSEFGVVDRRVGPYVGSDHFPVIVDLVMP